MKPPLVTILALLIALYCLVCLAILEHRNGAVPGGVLQAYHGEYEHGGSRKWRFGPTAQADPRRPLYNFITTCGIAVYPMALAGLLLAIVNMVKGPSRILFGVVAFICAAVLLRFMALGVLTAALPS